MPRIGGPVGRASCQQPNLRSSSTTGINVRADTQRVNHRVKCSRAPFASIGFQLKRYSPRIARSWLIRLNKYHSMAVELEVIGGGPQGDSNGTDPVLCVL